MKTAILILVAVIAAYVWNSSENAGIRETAAADRLRDSVQTALRLQDRIDAERAYVEAQAQERDSVLRDSLRQARAGLTVARREAHRLTAELESLLDADTTVSDTTRSAVIAAVRSLEHRATVCEAALDLADSTLSVCDGRLAQRDSAVHELRGHLSASTALAETYRRLSRPSFLTRVQRGLPWLAVGVLAGMFAIP